MNKELEQIFREKFDQFEADVSPDMFEKITAARAKKRGGLWMNWLKWSTAAVGIVALLWWGACQLIGTTDKAGQVAQPNSNATQMVQEAEPSVQEETINQNEGIVGVGNNLAEENSPEHVSRLQTTVETEPIQFEHFLPKHNLLVDENDAEFSSENSENQGSYAGEEASTELSTPEAVAFTPETAVTQEATPELATQELIEEDEISPDNLVTDDGQADIVAGPDDQAGDRIIKPKRKPLPLSVEVSVGPGYAFRSIHGPTEAVAWRNNTEYASVSYQAATHVVYRVSPQWNLMAGLNFSKRNEIFDFNQTVMTRDTIVEMDTTRIVQNTTEFMHNSRNSYHALSIPLSIEHTHYIRHRWSLLVKAGVRFSLYSQQTGLMRTGLTEITPLEDVEIERTGVWSTTVGLGAAYRVNPKVQFIVYPQLNFDLKASTSPNEVLTKDFGGFTHVGLRIDL